MRIIRLVVPLALLLGTALPAQERPRDPGDRADALVRAQQAQAKSQMEAARLKVVTAFESSADWTSAQAELKAAQSAYDQATQPVLAALREKPEYQQAVEAERAARAAVAAHEQTPPANPAQRLAPATEAMEAATAVTRMEQDALAADANVTELKARLTTATARVQQLTQQRDAAVLADPDWQAAKKLHDEALVNAVQNR